MSEYKGMIDIANKPYKHLSDEDSLKAVEALGTLSRLGILNWEDNTGDTLGIEYMATLEVIAHDGHCLSPYVLLKNTCGEQFSLEVGKRYVYEVLGAPTAAPESEPK
jgi:hypothetical protein